MKPEKIKLKSREKLNLISNLSTMINAGISILAAIGSLAEDARGNVKIVLQSIREDLLHGKRIHEAFAKFPQVFDTVSINMLHAAEESGTLDVALQDIKFQIKKDMALRRKIRSAMTYPIMVGVVLVLVLTMILVFVIPKIAKVFTQLQVDIPLPTRILMNSSYVLTHYPLLVLLGIGLITGGLVALFKFQKTRIIRVFTSLPLISRIAKNIDLWRFTRSMNLLLSSGTTVTTSLQLAEGIMVKPEIAQAIAKTHKHVLTGKSLTYSFKEQPEIFPSSMVELIQAGEQTGTLDTSLKNISEYLDEEINDSIAFVTTIMEPALLILVALLVGTLMVSIIGPIYGMIGNLGASNL